jgi:hypothetical protein
MKSTALFIIDSDPRASGRPAEAVRIAAGVGVWKRVDVTVYLRDAAVLILGENTAELEEAESYARYLPILSGLGRPIYVQQGASGLPQMGQGVVPFQEISDDALAKFAAERSQVLRF